MKSTVGKSQSKKCHNRHVISDFFVWGLIYSVQAPFYPNEALKRGAELSQSGLVFGILKLSGFFTATLYSLIGHKFSAINMAFFGSSTQGISVLLFGMLEYTDDKVVFLGFSYILRKAYI